MKERIIFNLWRFPPLIFTLLILHFTFFGSTASAQTLQVVTKTIEKTFDADRYPKVKVWGERSDIEIVTWGRNEIKATIELTAKHPDRNIAEKDLETLRYTADKSGRTVNLHNFVVLAKNGSKPQSNLKARFTLFVPANCAVEIQNNFGNIAVQGLQTIMQLQTEFCTIELSDLRGNINARTQFGALRAENLNGILSFVTERTDLLLQQIKGECRVRAQYGSLDIQTDKSQVKLDVETKNTELRNGTTAAKR
ncbi:hypothetical protein [Runella sp.]|uniref:hypothetical protein n=1 Tax=Runella sp. TaxID=1960881 RepID=UPI003D10B39E